MYNLTKNLTTDYTTISERINQFDITLTDRKQLIVLLFGEIVRITLNRRVFSRKEVVIVSSLSEIAYGLIKNNLLIRFKI